MRIGTCVLMLGACLVCGHASAEQAKEANAPKIDPKAQEVLRDMSTFMAKQKAFRVEVDGTTDVIQEDGQKVQTNSESDIWLERPNKLHAERKGDVSDAQIFYDGKTFTVHSRKDNVYAQKPAPPTLDQTIPMVQDKLDVQVGAGDLLFSDPAKALTEDAVSGKYLGRSVIDGVPTHHLAFRGNQVDWELWVEEGKRPLPRRYVITSKDMQGAPQHSATMSNWKLASDLPDETFRFDPPKGARKIEFVTPAPERKHQEKK